jgi:hypothetical protein
MTNCKDVNRVLALLLLAGLAGCGGGGGGGGTSDPTPPPPFVTGPTTSYLLNGEGGIATATVAMDSGGRFTLEGSNYTLQPGGTSGCTFTANPPETGSTTCNMIAGGRGFLLCDSTSGRHFDASLFRQQDAQAATVSELASTTMRGFSCGPLGPRDTGDTLTFNADSSIAVMRTPMNTHTYGTGMPAALAQENGFASTGNRRQRWAIYKVAVGQESTHYFLLDLWQNADPNAADTPVTMFTVQK